MRQCHRVLLAVLAVALSTCVAGDVDHVTPMPGRYSLDTLRRMFSHGQRGGWLSYVGDSLTRQTMVHTMWAVGLGRFLWMLDPAADCSWLAGLPSALRARDVPLLIAAFISRNYHSWLAGLPSAWPART